MAVWYLRDRKRPMTDGSGFIVKFRTVDASSFPVLRNSICIMIFNAKLQEFIIKFNCCKLFDCNMKREVNKL